jgi:hypothetical protein
VDVKTLAKHIQYMPVDAIISQEQFFGQALPPACWRAASLALLARFDGRTINEKKDSHRG